MTYQETLDFMFRQLPMYQRIGTSAFKKDLKNIIALCDHLGNPQNNFKSIHIGGTNGKGSTTHILSALLQSHGLKIGVYTSPHYKTFRERIKINASLIDRQSVVDFVDQNYDIITKIKPSFFEITVAMAFDYFSKKKIDYAIIEVGLGGRLDSTNIISPLLSVITNISLDHTHMLGNSIAEIANEKAGIIKEGIPIVIGETQDDAKDVFLEKAKAMNSGISFADQKNILITENEHKISLQPEDAQQIMFDASWWSTYQELNLRTAWHAYEKFCELEKFNALHSDTSKYLGNMSEVSYFIGRWQWITSKNGLRILADSAHNAAGLQLTMKRLSLLGYKKLHFVLGFSDDKDLDSIWSFFPTNANYYWAKANIPRGMDAEKLKQLGKDVQRKGRSYKSVKKALQAAKRRATPEDLIYVGGSIFVVAEIL